MWIITPNHSKCYPAYGVKFPFYRFSLLLVYYNFARIKIFDLNLKLQSLFVSLKKNYDLATFKHHWNELKKKENAKSSYLELLCDFSLIKNEKNNNIYSGWPRWDLTKSTNCSKHTRLGIPTYCHSDLCTLLQITWKRYKIFKRVFCARSRPTNAYNPQRGHIIGVKTFRRFITLLLLLLLWSTTVRFVIIILSAAAASGPPRDVAAAYVLLCLARAKG